jgi:hypothetical protein
MTVTELIERLQRMPPDLRVFRYANWECEEVSQQEDTPETDDEQPCVTLY